MEQFIKAPDQIEDNMLIIAVIKERTSGKIREIPLFVVKKCRKRQHWNGEEYEDDPPFRFCGYPTENIINIPDLLGKNFNTSHACWIHWENSDYEFKMPHAMYGSETKLIISKTEYKYRFATDNEKKEFIKKLRSAFPTSKKKALIKLKEDLERRRRYFELKISKAEKIINLL